MESKLKITDDYFSTIDSETKAYFLGQIAGCEQICPLYENMTFIVTLSNNKAVVSHKMACDICKIFRVFFGESSNNILFPTFEKSSYNWAFIRGLFDQQGYIKEDFECGILNSSKSVKKSIEEFSNIKCTITDEMIIFSNTNALDFLSKLYDNVPDNIKNMDKYALYKILLGYNNSVLPVSKIFKADVNAVMPFKNRCSDEGYDLVLISVDKKISDNTIRYDTGICVQPPNGWHIELIPRSSLSNSGYILSNSVGLIDSNYRGTLKVVLTKINEKANDIILPFRAVQMVLRKNHHFLCEQTDTLDDTQRSSGGFGSSN